MIGDQAYLSLLADLINREPVARTRERRVREANRMLYRELVRPDANDTQADLVLAAAAQHERQRIERDRK